VAFASLIASAAHAQHELTPEELRFFESKIRPVLIEHCYGCHSNKVSRPKAGLLLDTRDSMLRGGRSGPAIVPGDPDASLLIQLIRAQDPDEAMPPDGMLPASAIADLVEWVRRDAPDPRNAPTARAGEALPPLATGADTAGQDHDASGAYESLKGRDPASHWAFRKVSKPAVPEVQDASWPLNDIDRFILAALEQRGLKPVRDADRRTLLRRLSFDLLGLPPTPEALAAFEKDTRPDAIERVVDELLASPHFGERWGRHWLDVARYAESSGKETNVLYPHAYRYRDYVIRAVNADVPYDRFITEQIAGDLLPWTSEDERAWNLIATGYLAVGSKGHNTRGRQQFAMDLADEQIDALTQGVMALTVSCARCHDHKFDPIPQRDYYAVAGIFLSSSTHFGGITGPGNTHATDLVILPNGASVSSGGKLSPIQRAAYETALARAERALGEAGDMTEVQRNARAGDERARLTLTQQRRFQATARTAREVLDRFDERGEPTAMNRVAMGVIEGRPTDARLLERGELDRGGDRVPRGPVTALDTAMPAIAAGSGRIELAQWITSPEHPLTARVMVNRVWLHLFGKGLVPTPDNFGMAGLPPANAALLDHLAAGFVESGWSVKSLIREIVLSHAYRLSTESAPENLREDPDNTLVWRMNRKRLEGEAIRDAMLATSGRLDRSPPSGSIVNGLEGDLRNPGIAALVDRAPPPVRSVYLPVVRDHVPESLELFDFPDPAFVTGARDATSVPTQALYLLNGADVGESARALAQRLVTAESRDAERITLAFELLYGRRPSTGERQALSDFLKDFASAQGGDASAAQAANAGAGAAGRRAPGTAGGPPNRRGPAARALAERSGRAQTGANETGSRLGTTPLDAWTAACRALLSSAEFRMID